MNVPAGIFSMVKGIASAGIFGKATDISGKGVGVTVGVVTGVGVMYGFKRRNPSNGEKL